MKASYLLLLLWVFFNADISAQKNRVKLQDWKIAGSIPSNDQRTEALGLGGPIAGHSNGVLIVAGGSNFPDGMPWKGGKKKYHQDGYIFRKATTGTFKYIKSFSLPYPLAYAAVCTTNEGIVVAGGENENGITSKVILLSWDEELQRVVLKDIPQLPFELTNASIAAHQNKLYLAGGERANDVSDQLLVLDFKNLDAGWQSFAPVPKRISHAVMLVQSKGENSYIYLIGGRKRNAGNTSDLYGSTFRYEPATNTWVSRAELPYALSAGTGVVLPDQSIVLFGGDTGQAFHKTESLIVSIANEKDSLKRQQLDMEKQFVQSSHPGFCRQVLLYDDKKDEWVKSGCVPFDVPVTTTAILWDQHVLIPSGEIRAGTRSPRILSVRIDQ